MRACLLLIVCAATATSSAQELERLRYNNPGLTVDLGVGLWAWPLPMDYDGDGDLDLVVVSGGKPFEGVWFFENPGGDRQMPVFKPPVKVGDYLTNAQVSYVDGEVRVLTPGKEYPNFLQSAFAEPVELGVTTDDVHLSKGRIRANQWRYADYDGDDRTDLIVGVGDWADYGWDDAYDEHGRWVNGPLRGLVYWLRNEGSNDAPRYAKAASVMAGDKPIDVFGMPSPNFADFDGDGDLDLVCGEFLDQFTYFENIGTRTEPVYAAGRRLDYEGRPVAMHVQMTTPTAIDWDGDGDIDLIVGDEDGRVALIENLGQARFAPPRYFQQEAEFVKFGALATPFAFDWDDDGDQDLIVGNTAGNIAFIENLDGGDPPKWAAPVLLEAGGRPIRIQAGPNGSIQGPAEAKWGYTTLSAADWDGDGLPDLIVNSIWGKVVWYRNRGTRAEPRLEPARPVLAVQPRKPAWTWWRPAPHEFVTQWRTTPFAIDWNRDGRMDLVMLDDEGYLAFFERAASGMLEPGKRVFYSDSGQLLRLNDGHAGRSGRRKIQIVDWDGDGRLDLLVNSINASVLRNLSQSPGKTVFSDEGPLSGTALAGHTTSPTAVDWDGDGVPDLLIGAEDGHFYYLKQSR